MDGMPRGPFDRPARPHRSAPLGCEFAFVNLGRVWVIDTVDEIRARSRGAIGLCSRPVKESAADLATRTANLVHTTRAFEHGEAAFGARYVKPGFARTPEDDLAFALGWPHVRSLIEGHPNDRITNEAQIEKVVFAPQVGLAVPREIALRRIRAFSSFANSPDGKLRPGALRAMQNRDPMTEEQAQTFVLEHLAGRSLGTKQLEVVFLLEAVAGPEAIAEAITTAFEKTQDAQLLDHAVDKSTWAFAVGFLLLRARTDVSLALRDRLKAIIARCPRHDVNKSSVANVLDQVLHQNAATLRSDPTDQSLLLHWVDRKSVV